jgi:hypothetical protein
MLRHNLDVMHIENNVFENIFKTVMDVKGKTKDNIKAKLDIALFCNRKNMELVCDESRVAKPRASFVLEKNAQILVYKWLKSLRFPDGHASMMQPYYSIVSPTLTSVLPMFYIYNALIFFVLCFEGTFG